jgi:two-component system phosphate regulon sensor histidine kinase PhoR
MKRSILWRAFGGYIAVGLLTVLLFTFYTLSTLRESSTAGLTERLESIARAASVGVRPLLLSRLSAELNGLARELGRQTRTRLTIIDRSGSVLADSEVSPATMENHRLRPEVARALEGNTGVALRFSSTIERWLVYVAVPLELQGRIEGVVRASAPRAELAALLGRSRGNLALFASLLFLACLLMAFLYWRSILRPLRHLVATVSRFTAGDFGARLHLRRRDEIWELAESFNSLGERLQQLFREATQRSEELERIFSSVQQGICLLDGQNRIQRCNRGFETLVGGRPATGRALWEVVIAPGLSELIQKARATGERQSDELVIGERLALCSVERMAGREELLVVLLDTTDIRRLDAVKRDFVANASHELRTPLTSIKGFLEMLGGKLAGEEGRWLQAIQRNAERMAAIVEDLLTLSRLEARGTEISREPTDLKRLVADVTGMFANPIKSKGLGLRVSIPEDLPPSLADPFLLEQMLVNLVDNALKYTEKGEIRVACCSSGGRSSVEISDTGIGIAAEHLPRIFERFYVADKSRSRKMGGTGLGLAIVKHIAQLHDGTVEVHSTLGVGTTFTVSLPAIRRTET